MNLGGIFLETAIFILLVSFLLLLVVAVIVRVFTKWSWGMLLTAALFLGGVLGVVGLKTLQQPLFTAWHREQNTMVPRTDCIRYEPEVTRLYAVYRMSRQECDRWVAAHPWKLLPRNSADTNMVDQQRLGFTSPEAAWATEPAPNGKQLCVYYERGMMYLAYYAM